MDPYGWWCRNPVNSPVDVVDPSISYGFSTIPSGCWWISEPSTVSVAYRTFHLWDIVFFILRKQQEPISHKTGGESEGNLELFEAKLEEILVFRNGGFATLVSRVGR